MQAARACGAAQVIAIDSVPERLAMASPSARRPFTWTRATRAVPCARPPTGVGVDVRIDAVGHPAALDLALRLTRKCGTVQTVGVYAERAELHMGLVWIKALRCAPAMPTCSPTWTGCSR